ncbi:MAG: C39 family peptidase [Candidatus Sumerlaeaceae bacterium]|nr:C39 family peptidase [Candidatus Sumerlaeaceae bacterium]
MLRVAFVFVWLGALWQAGWAQENRLGNPPGTVDRLVVIEGAQALLSRAARSDGIEASPDGSGVQLAAGATAGVLELKPVAPEIPFNEVLPSWNGYAPEGTGFRVSLSAGRTGWFEAGTWGSVPNTPEKRSTLALTGGSYFLDYLVLEQPAKTVAVRVELFRPEPSAPSPVVRLIALALTNSTGDRRLAKRFGAGKPAVSAALARLETTRSATVPFRSQVVPNTKWIGRLCSPASVASALEHFGVNLPTQEVAAKVYDPSCDMFGVWHRNIQGAAQMGLRGYLRRFRNFDDVAEELARGSVIAASIRFKFGELDPRHLPRMYQKRGTEGHIIVVEGFAPGGGVIVHDSASKDFGRHNVWRQEDLAKAWFDKGGVAYVFTGLAAGAKKAPASQRDAKVR